MNTELAMKYDNPGPWDSEPDELAFKHAGLACWLFRHRRMGHWCGYVVLPSTHPLVGVKCNEESDYLREAKVARLQQPVGEHPSFAVMLSVIGGDFKATPEGVYVVHGGVTYAGKLRDVPEAAWAFGFDCSHCHDLAPGQRRFGMSFESDQVYRDMAYARTECEKLAEQLAIGVTE